MHSIHKNKRHNLNKNIASKNNVPSNKYLRDFYLKDFKYISPEILKVNKKLKPVDVTKQTCRLLVRKWGQEVMVGLKQFLYQGSLHGVKYIFEPSFSRKERAAWVIIMAISVAICTAVIIQLFSKSNSTPFVNVIDSLPTPIWAIPFPSVVLCPHLHVQLSYANVSELDDLHQFFASRICPQMFSENRSLEQRMNPKENEMLQDFIVKVSPKCTDLIKTCNWRGTNQHTKWMTDECCGNFFKPIFTNYGLCYTFNGLPLDGMTNITIPWQRSFSQPQVFPGTLQWGLDSGYPKVFPPDPTILPFRVRASGESNGLGVELFLNTSEHQFACDGGSLGFNLLITSPTDHVYTSTVLRLPMDRMTTIEVYPITYKTDGNLRPLSPERRQCFFQNERKLVYYEFYTDNNCKQDLLIREAVRVCNCVLYNWPRRSVSETICSTALDFHCIDDIKAKVEEQLIYAYYTDSEEERPSRAQSSSCHPPCNDILYSSQVFYSDLVNEPGDATPDWGLPTMSSGSAGEHEGGCDDVDIAVPNALNLNGILKGGEVTRINVHFFDDIFLGQHRHAQYDDYYFIGAIGGLLSLFMGFSIISVAELIYFVVLRPLHAVIKESLG